MISLFILHSSDVYHLHVPVSRLYSSLCPLEDAVVDRLSTGLEPLHVCTVEDMHFDKPDVAHGPWRNFCTGIVGNVAHAEAEVLWPNQVCMPSHSPNIAAYTASGPASQNCSMQPDSHA